jgi:hypothetical protein
MLRLLCLDSIANAKMKYPIFTDIINNGSKSERDDIINMIHAAISNMVCGIIVKFKNIKIIN